MLHAFSFSSLRSSIPFPLATTEASWALSSRINFGLTCAPSRQASSSTTHEPHYSASTINASPWAHAQRITKTAQSIRNGFLAQVSRVSPAIVSPHQAELSPDSSVKGITSISPSIVDKHANPLSPTTDAEISTSTAETMPDFTIVSAGLGSMILVSLPPGTKVYAQKGCNIGQSVSVATQVSTLGGPFKSTLRKLRGGPLFFHVFSTRSVSGDVLLAPRGIGDVAVLDMNGADEYYVRRHSYLASTSGISLSMRLNGIPLTSSSTDTGLVHYRASGLGKLAITTYGGLYCLKLAPGEAYRVSAKHLIVWSCNMTPQPIPTEESTVDIKEIVSSTVDINSPSQSNIPLNSSSVSGQPNIPASLPAIKESKFSYQMIIKVASQAMRFLTLLTVKTAQGGMYIITRTRRKFQSWVMGQDELVELVGPGQVFIASRLLPRFDLLRNISSTNANEIQTQQPNRDPAPAKPSISLSDSLKAGITNLRLGKFDFGKIQPTSGSKSDDKSPPK